MKRRIICALARLVLLGAVLPWMDIENAKVQTMNMLNNCTNDKHKDHQQLIILKGFRQNGLRHWIQRILLRRVAPVNNYFRHLLEVSILEIDIMNKCIILTFWRLGTMLKRFFKAKSFRLHIPKPKEVPTSIEHHPSRYKKTQTINMCHICMYNSYVSLLCIVAMYHCYAS